MINTQRTDDGLLKQLEDWMQLETNPYWAMTHGIHGNDIPARVQTYLQATQQSNTVESYPLPL